METAALGLITGFLNLSLAIVQPAHADTLVVKGMSCRACEKQVTAVVCQDKDMTQWFEACTAKVTDAKNEIGEIRYTLKPGLTLDGAKYSQIEKAVVDSGRTLEKPAAASKTVTK